VSRAAAGEWAGRLLPLPRCLAESTPASSAEVVDGLRTTGHFLHAHLAPAQGDAPLPAARDRLVALLARSYTSSR
jgi:DNA repair protein RecO (recombination protein O)